MLFNQHKIIVKRPIDLGKRRLPATAKYQFATHSRLLCVEQRVSTATIEFRPLPLINEIEATGSFITVYRQRRITDAYLENSRARARYTPIAHKRRALLHGLATMTAISN